jgi:hypothetical protein
MTGSESESSAAVTAPVVEETPFVERDDHETRMPMGSGGVPFYIGIAWVGFIIVYVVVMSIIALPDLRAWIRQ